MMNKVRWGMLSTANIGLKSLVPAIRASQHGEFVAVSSRTLDKAQQAAAEFDVPKAYGTYEELLADPDIDAIYNPLPNHMHAEWSIKAAEAGKAVLCEKPFASDAAEAQMMVDAFRSRGLLLTEAFMYRFHPQQDRVKQLIAEGAIGKVQIIRANFTFPMDEERHKTDIRTQPDMAGGSLMDVGCYPVNLMRLITGEEPIRATGSAIWAASGTDDNFVGTLQFPSGVLGHFDSGFLTTYDGSYEIRGNNGRILCEQGFVSPKDQEKTIKLWRGNDLRYEEVKVPAANHYELIVEDLNQALIHKRPPRFEPEDGVANMRTIDMLYASARSV